MNNRFFAILLLCLAGLLAACGGNSAPPRLDPNTPEGKGQELFERNCASCHRVAGDEKLVGPSLANIAVRAGERVQGLSAEDYLYESIVDPDKYVVDGYKKGTMQQNFASRLSAAELDYLVAYLLTLK